VTVEGYSRIMIDRTNYFLRYLYDLASIDIVENNEFDPSQRMEILWHEFNIFIIASLRKKEAKLNA